MEYNSLIAIIIGNEILDDFTNDRNLKTIANACLKHNIHLKSAHFIRDDIASIAKTIHEIENSYIITTGGLGHTHDDVTPHAIAKLYNCKTESNAHITKPLISEYICETAFVTYDKNKIIFSCPGTPRFVKQNVIAWMETLSQNRKKIIFKNITVNQRERGIQKYLSAMQNKYQNDITIGIYSVQKDKLPSDVEYACNITCSGYDEDIVNTCITDIKKFCE